MNPPSPLFTTDTVDGLAPADGLSEAIRICEVLRQAGHVAYFAGGCVRDALLGREPKDYDVATDATPERVRDVFGRRRTLAFGASFGVIGVLPPRGAADGDQGQDSEASAKAEGATDVAVGPTEVATFRSDGEYSDGRRPDKVHFGDAEQDALRRDFTINGLFYDPDQDEVIDFVGGREDLSKRRLRTIGTARDRFEEDKLRMLRAVRFATTLEFALDEETLHEIQVRADEIGVVSAERIGAEMRRLMVANAAAEGLALLIESRLSEQILPSLEKANVSVWRRYLDDRVDARFETAMAVLLLAFSQSERSGTALKLLKDVAKRWRLSNEELRQIKTAMNSWDVIVNADQLKWSQVQPYLVDRDASVSMAVAETIMRADGLEQRGWELCVERLSLPKEQLDPEPLVSGETLQRAGYRPGREFRDWLHAARVAQLDGEVTTESEAMDLIAKMAAG